MHNEIEYVFNLLENHRLKEALVQIHAMASQCSSWQLRTDVETLQTTYDLMLQYNAKGIKDPKQKDMYNKNIPIGLRNGRTDTYHEKQYIFFCFIL